MDLFQNRLGVRLRELVRGRQLDVEAALLGCHQAVELAGDLRDLPNAALLGGEPQEVAQELIRLADDLDDDVGLRLGGQLRVTKDCAQLGNVAYGRSEVAELLGDLLQATLLLRGLEEGAGVGAVDGGYRTVSGCSSTEKSSSLIASSIRRLWSESSSTLPVTFAVAISVSSATSARI